MFLYIDIETIPCQRDGIWDEIAASVDPPANMSKAETIAKWEADKKPDVVDEKYRRTALDGTLGEIVVIGCAIDDRPAFAEYRDLSVTESDFLSDALQLLADHLSDRSPTWVGHYITGFDLRFIWQRCVINNVAPPLKIPHNAKPWDSQIFDTKTEWSGISGNSTSNLDALCKAMGMPGKGDIDGSKVWDYVKEGRVEEVAEYCKADVDRTRELHRRMTFTNNTQQQKAT